MKTLNLLLLCLLLTGCEEEPVTVYNPPGATGQTTVIDIPKAYRVKNYAKGSCQYASTACLLNTQGKKALAKYVRANYSGGARPEHVMAIFDEAGLDYTYGEGLNFLRRCHNRRLYCVVGWPEGHAVNFVGMDKDYVYLLDNNWTESYTRVPIQTFVYQWQGWGIALVEKSVPPSLTKRGNHGP